MQARGSSWWTGLVDGPDLSCSDRATIESGPMQEILQDVLETGDATDVLEDAPSAPNMPESDHAASDVQKLVNECSAIDG